MSWSAVASAALLALAATATATGPLDQQRRVSALAPDGDPNLGAGIPAIAYDPFNRRYLVVYADESPNNFTEIYGRFLDENGVPIFAPFPISQMGDSPVDAFAAADPDVAFNSFSRRFLVVWDGDDNKGGLVDNEIEVFGQLLDENGVQVEDDDFRISLTGPPGAETGDASYTTSQASVAANPFSGQFLVAWTGEETSNDFEIHGRRVGSLGEFYESQSPISELGGPGDTTLNSDFSDIAFNPISNEYLVVFHGEQTDGKFEIFGQRLLAGNLAPTGSDDFRISHNGAGRQAFRPDVAANAANGQYLVVWDANTLLPGKYEIFSERLSVAGGVLDGSDEDTRISAMEPLASGEADAFYPGVAYRASRNEFLVGWRGDTSSPPLVNDEFEVFARRVGADGLPLDTQSRVSNAGPPADPNYGVTGRVVIADGGDTGRAQLAWTADDNQGGVVDNQVEVFTRPWGTPPQPPPPSPPPPPPPPHRRLRLQPIRVSRPRRSHRRRRRRARPSR